MSGTTATTGSSTQNQVLIRLLWLLLGWSQECFPKSDSLLLLAKLYLIQWVFPCTVDFPNVINFNVKESCELCCLAPSPGCCVDVFSLFPNSGGLGKLG